MPPRAKAADSGSRSRRAAAVVVPKRARGDLEGHHHHVVEYQEQGRKAVRCVARVSDPQGQADLEDGVVEKEDGFGGDVGEVGAVLPRTCVCRLGRGCRDLRGGDSAGGGRGFTAAQGEERGGEEGQGVAGEEPQIRGGGAERQGRRGGEAAQGPARVGDGALDSLVADAARSCRSGGVEPGEDARRAVAEAADGRDGEEQGVVVRGEERERGQCAQELDGEQDSGEREPVGDAAAQGCACDANGSGDCGERADLRDGEARAADLRGRAGTG
jgi:hypothetical protein